MNSSTSTNMNAPVAAMLKVTPAAGSGQ
jgi:hypothetical protein